LYQRQVDDLVGPDNGSFFGAVLALDADSVVVLYNVRVGEDLVVADDDAGPHSGIG